MNVVREISRINQTELDIAIKTPSASWHQQYSDSAYIFIGGLPYDLTEGDVITIFSQYGEIVDVNLPRVANNPKQDDRAESSSRQKQPSEMGKGKHRGFGFLMYEDQRSTVLAVDNLNGAQVLGRTLRVDHVAGYKQPKVVDEEGKRVDADVQSFNAAPAEMGLSTTDEAEADLEDPMAAYIQRQKRDESGTSRHDDEHDREEKRRRKEERARIRAEREQRRRAASESDRHKHRSSHRDHRERKHHRSSRKDHDDSEGEGVNRYEQMKKSRSVLDAHRDGSSHPRSRSRSRSRSPQRSIRHREDRSRRDDDRDTHSHHRRRRDEHRSQPSTSSSDRYGRTDTGRRRSRSPL
ncbi:U2 snRNP component IST3 [Pseudozyma hubeiensis]|nr:U2 snRNP component IST3 [Pseudozyma hubeiensis]